MTVALVLGLYVAVLGVVPARLLARSSWPARAPRWGILGWQALSLSAVLATVAAGLALALPALRLSGGLSQLLRACVMALRARYSSPGGALTAAVGAALALLVVAVAVWCVARELLLAGRARRLHRDLLQLTARPGETPGRPDGPAPLVVEHTSLAAYCLPGRGGRIVLTSAAVAALTPAELDAVLAHERAHLAGRHHLLLAISNGLARGFWFVPLFGAARDQTAVLVEMLADDRARQATGRLTVAGALLALAGPGPAPATPASALGATTTATGDRVRRLLDSAAPLSPAGRLLAAGASTGLLLAPLVVLLTPALALANSSYCPA